jgi:hypothetical protein
VTLAPEPTLSFTVPGEKPRITFGDRATRDLITSMRDVTVEGEPPVDYASLLPPTPPELPAGYTVESLLEEAIAIHQKGDLKGAQERYRIVLQHQPQNPLAIYYTAISLSQGTAPSESILAMMRHASKGMPGVPEVHYNIGIMLHRLGREEEAQVEYQEAIRLLPALVEAKTSLAGCYLNQGDLVRGKMWLKQAANTRSASLDSVYSRGFAKLQLGDYFGGWKDYDERWKTSSFLVENRRDFGKLPHWTGQAMPGTMLYLHTEQGAGDVIMFSRFIAEVKRLSRAYVVLEVGGNVTDFLRGCPGVDRVIASNTAVPKDVPPMGSYLPLMGMMRQVGMFSERCITHRNGWVPDPAPEFFVPLPPTDKPRVGIAWAGSKAHKNDLYRSVPWALWRDLLVLDERFRDRVQWVSLQVGDRARDVDDGGGKVGLVDPTPLCREFAHTSTVARQLDLLISVDTATVHMSAAMLQGPPVWMLLAAAPDWRWGLTGERTPWYDRVRMIRQRHYKDWETPVKQAADWLAQWLSAYRKHDNAQPIREAA